MGITFGIAAIVSGFMVGIRQDKRAIHDLIAGTYVTYEKARMMKKIYSTGVAFFLHNQVNNYTYLFIKI